MHTHVNTHEEQKTQLKNIREKNDPTYVDKRTLTFSVLTSVDFTARKTHIQNFLSKNICINKKRSNFQRFEILCAVND